MKTKKFLKFYLWLTVFIFSIIFWKGINGTEYFDFFDGVDYIIYFVAIVGIYGYCYDKEIFSKKFWKVFLPFIIIWDFFILAETIYSDPEAQEPLLASILAIVYFLFWTPEYIGLYLYGYKHKEK